MAFTGAAVIEQISDRCVRVTGVSLAAGASGILGLFGGSVVGAVALPDAFNPKPYEYNGNTVTLIESIRVTVNPAGSAQPATAVPVRVEKAGAGLAFGITFTNDDAAAATSDDLEIYIEFRD